MCKRGYGYGHRSWIIWSLHVLSLPSASPHLRGVNLFRRFIFSRLPRTLLWICSFHYGIHETSMGKCTRELS